MFPLRETLANIHILHLIFLETRINNCLHFAADIIGMPYSIFPVGPVTFQPFKVIRGHWLWYQSRVCDFLLVRNIVTLVLSCTVSEILQVFVLLIPPLFHPILGCFRWTRSLMLGAIWAGALSYLAVELLLKYSNVCEKHTWRSQTDRRTDKRRTVASPRSALHRDREAKKMITAELHSCLVWCCQRPKVAGWTPPCFFLRVFVVFLQFYVTHFAAACS